MSSGFDFSVGLAHKFCSAWGKAGGIPAELNLLSQNKDVMRGVLKLFRDLDSIVDGEADAVLPERYGNGFRVVSTHKKMGVIHWDPKYITFFVDPRQEDGDGVSGNILLPQMLEMNVLNANFLDFLLARPHLIPDNWKKDEQGETLTTVFWGTTYRCPNPKYSSQRDVRTLFWMNGYWNDGEMPLDSKCHLMGPTYRAAILKKF